YEGALITKLPRVKTTIFTTMSALAAECNGTNLTQGFPDFAPSSLLIEEVEKALRAGQNQYATMPGLMLLREEIARKTEELYSAQYDPDSEITVTAGATQAIFTAILSIIREGDEVILMEPAYDSYLHAVELA